MIQLPYSNSEKTVKPIQIENAEVVEGGDDYTPEELEQLKVNTKSRTCFNFDGTNANERI
jgi:hypothetical protein